MQNAWGKAKAAAKDAAKKDEDTKARRAEDRAAAELEEAARLRREAS